MIKISVDSVLVSRLGGLADDVELCGPNGDTVAYIHLISNREDLVEFYSWAKSQLSDQEICCLRQQTGGKSLAEILQALPTDLEQRATDLARGS